MYPKGRIGSGPLRIDQDTMSALIRAAERKLEISEEQAEHWVMKHAEEIMSEFEFFAPAAVAAVIKPPKPVEAPVVVIKSKTGATIQLWVYDSRQSCAVAEHRQFHFGMDTTAGLVYVDKHPNWGIRADEHNINNPSTWAWIQKWMKRGLVAAGHMAESELTAEEKEG